MFNKLKQRKNWTAKYFDWIKQSLLKLFSFVDGISFIRVTFLVFSFPNLKVEPSQSGEQNKFAKVGEDSL